MGKERAMRSAAVFGIAAALAAPLAIADVHHATIPESFWGSWAASAQACAAQDGMLVFSAKAYETAQAKCVVDWVMETASPRGPVYSARLRCSAQAPQPALAMNLIIRPDNAGQISVGADFDSLKVYLKCAAKEGR
jgi:hypothetical protein